VALPKAMILLTIARWLPCAHRRRGQGLPAGLRSDFRCRVAAVPNAMEPL